MSEGNVTPPSSSWRKTELSGWALFTHPALHVAREAADGGVELTLVGHAIHLEEQSDDLDLIVRLLLQKRLISRQAYLDELEELSGRYVVIDSDGCKTWIQSDAAALRNVYYHPTRRVLASHMNLVAEVLGGLPVSRYGSAEWRRRNRSFSTPGSETHWEGVKFLNANLELRLEDFQVRRVAMRPPYELTVEASADEVLDLTRLQLPFLTANDRPVVSLTAGQDSRTTLAILRPRRSEFHYFTYALHYAPRKRAVRQDLTTSQRLAEEMQLGAHTVFHLHGPLEPGMLRGVLERNHVRASGRNLVPKYLYDLPPTRMHIRSSFNEIAVATFRNQFGMGEATPELLAEILTYKEGYTSDTLVATSNYVESTRLRAVPGYDPLDLYYWELRMGSWLGTITAESDLAFDTHILINSRRIIRTLLAPPLEDRLSARVYRRIVGKAWPELYSIPVNGELLS